MINKTNKNVIVFSSNGFKKESQLEANKSSKNRFSSVEMNERQKLKLYNKDRIYNQEDFRKIVEQKNSQNIDLINSNSPYKKSRIGTSIPGIKSSILQNSDINKGTKFDKSLMNKSTSSFFKDQIPNQNQNQQNSLVMSKSHSNFFSSNNQYRNSNTAKKENAGNSINENMIGTTYNNLFNTNRNFKEAFAESFNNHNERDSIFRDEEYNIVDKEIESLLYYYSTFGDSSKVIKKSEEIFKMEATKVFEKHNLGQKISKEELLYIRKILKEHGILDSNGKKLLHNYFRNNAIINPGDNLFFDNPVEAKEIIKHNQDIHDLVSNYRIDKQINKFKEKYVEYIDFKNKISNMPKVKEIVKKPKVVKKNDTDDEENKNALKIDKTPIINNQGEISREAILLNSIEILGLFIDNQCVRPSSRSYATFTLTDFEKNEAILFGGCAGHKLDDFWKLKIDNKSSSKNHILH